MTLQNRVGSTGEIVSDPGGGLLMGNGGCIHAPDRRLGVSRWRSKLWICCVLEWKDVRRDPMPPGRWTALFFLDEATALAAGHRPCAYCRRADYLAYAEAWRRAENLPRRRYAGEMDARLHAERVDSRTRRQRTRLARAGDLPDGAMVRYEDRSGLLVGGRVLPWTFGRYGDPVPTPATLPATEPVELLTPPPTAPAIAARYRPPAPRS